MDPKILNQQYKALGSVYDPEVNLINQQMAALPGQAKAQKTALEQAKVNAFRDITSQAQGRGVYFSGFRPSEEARYTGERFLPALAELEGQQSQARTALQQALIDVSQRRQQQATSQAQTILDRQQQERQFQQELAASRSSGGGGGDSLPSTAQFLTQAFSGYKPAYEGGTPYYTEREVIPALMANYGLDEAAAKRMAFNYRKRVFGEGFGR